jgi:hypothetical protein
MSLCLQSVPADEIPALMTDALQNPTSQYPPKAPDLLRRWKVTCVQESEYDITRLDWIYKIIASCKVARGQEKDADAILADAKLEYSRFSHVATEDFAELFEYGQRLQAANLKEFLELWQVKVEERAREAQMAARQVQSRQEQARLTSPHPNRDAIFAKWGFA